MGSMILIYVHAQASGRRVAYHTFSHVLDLDISFHLERRTGALSRILERGELTALQISEALPFDAQPHRTLARFQQTACLVMSLFAPTGPLHGRPLCCDA